MLTSSPGLLADLRSRRGDTLAEGRRILDAAEAQHRNLTPAESARWESITSEVDQLDARISQLDDFATRTAAVGRMADKYPGIARQIADRFTVERSSGDDGALRSFLAGETRAVDVDLAGIETRVNPRTGAWSVGESRALSVGTASAGGNTVPTTFRSELMEHLVAASAIRQTNVTVLTSDNGDQLQIPKTTAHSTASIIGEGTTITESDPTFGQTVLGAFKYAIRVTVSTELLTDSGVDITSYLARECGRALGNASGADFVKGAGSTSAPQGVVGVATTGKTGSTGVTGAFNDGDLIDLYYSVLPEYRANGFWLMSDVAAAACRKLKDATSGRYLWEGNLAAGQPPLLLGRPVVIDPNVDAPGLSKKSVLFGDFSRYVIRDVRGVRFEASTDYAFDTDQVSFRAILRTDGDLVDTTGAIKAFVGAAS